MGGEKLSSNSSSQGKLENEHKLAGDDEQEEGVSEESVTIDALQGLREQFVGKLDKERTDRADILNRLH